MDGKRSESPNDRKLSDTPERRGTCVEGGKAAVEAGAVTRRRVRCSAWLGVAVIANWGLWRVDDALLGGNVFELVEVRPSHALVGIASAILELEAPKANAEVIPCEYSDSLWRGFGDSG